ncbi:hypothetical protein F5144DRAFT_494492 [Chaetomium tenue]|uniref:Uncharacterized protein n=1 Tax=Chaetomium tenue TaxID=1854479 RepID=A0ACB7P5Y4_9PEZI|nr:hypothetical protein F5144DRAFT_494492 [Chaetomium globosum]
MTTFNSTPMAEQRATLKPSRGLPGSHNLHNLVNGMPQSDSLSHGRKKASEGGVVKELIGHFRQRSLPPGNYKLTPDMPDVLNMAEEGPKKRDSWFSLWPFRMKHESKKESKPQGGNIRLPDSTVAAMTTKGHRYIAICIPPEFSYLEPAGRKPINSTARPRGELDQGDGTEGRSQHPEKQHCSETPYITDNNLLFPPWNLTGPNDLTRPRSVAVTSTWETGRLQRSASTDTYLTNPWSEQRQSPCQPLGQDRSTQEGVRASAGCSTDRQHLGKSSSSESFFTTTSELISSDAVTVHIPSPAPPGYQNTLAEETGTDKHSAPDPAQSHTAIYGRDTRKGKEVSNGEGSPTPPTGAPSQSHTLPNTSRTLHIARVMARHHLIRAPDIDRDHSHASLPLAQPWNEEPSTDTPHLTTADSGIPGLTPHTNTPSNPTSPRLSRQHGSRKEQRNSEIGSGSASASKQEQDSNTDVDFLHRYTASFIRVHDLEMEGLLARIETLEETNAHWVRKVASLLERVSCQLASTSPSAGNVGGAGLGYHPEAGSGSGSGSNSNDLARSQSRSSGRRSGTSGLGPSYYDRGGVFTPTRLDNCHLEEGSKQQNHTSRRVDVSSLGDDGRRVRDCGVVEDGVAGDKSWSRDDSSVHAGYLGSSSLSNPRSGDSPEEQEGGDLGDATGLGTVEGLMRDLIQTAQDLRIEE